MDEGLELSLGFAAINNLIGALLVTSDWTVFQTHYLKRCLEPQAGIDVILPVLVIYPILLYIFSKKYQWKDWKEKLTGTIDLNKSIKQHIKNEWKKITYKNVHNRFKLNGVHLDKQDLCSLSYSLLRKVMF
jgi:hypothetical protein